MIFCVIHPQVQHNGIIRIFYGKGCGVAFSDVTPRIQYHSTKTRARPAPTHILEGQTSIEHSKGGSFFQGAIIQNSSKYLEPVLMFEPMGWQDTKINQIWD